MEQPKQNPAGWIGDSRRKYLDYFSELYSNITKNDDQYKILRKWKTLEAVIKNNQNPLDYPVTEQELIEVIQSLKGKKACGVDGILNEMIKYSDHKIRSNYQTQTESNYSILFYQLELFQTFGTKV